LTFLPNILLRRLYKKGSLRSIDEGISFELKNILGPGIITKVNFIRINDHKYDSTKIILRSNEKDVRLNKVSENSPLFIAFKQIGMLIIQCDNCLVDGKNKIEMELISREAGLIKVKVFDNVSV